MGHGAGSARAPFFCLDDMRKILTIDCEYEHPEFAAAYLVHEGQRAYFVETNTVHAVPKMMDALAQAGLKPAQVEWIIITHVHLDHAAGAYALMEACPQAKLLCHPRARKHVVDPSRLEASARQVYGDETFERLYGKLSGVPVERVYSPADGEKIPFGSSELEFLHTRGHANHHFCIHDPVLSGVFTGDSFGLAYPALQKSGKHIFPSSSPTEFNAAEAKASVQRIAATGASFAFLTHFGTIDWIAAAKTSLLEQLEFSEQLEKRVGTSDLIGKELVKYCEAELRKFLVKYWASANLTPDHWALVKMDIELNAAGIAYSAEKGRSTPGL